MFVILFVCLHRAKMRKDTLVQSVKGIRPELNENGIVLITKRRQRHKFKRKMQRFGLCDGARGISYAVRAIHFVSRLLCATNLYEIQ